MLDIEAVLGAIAMTKSHLVTSDLHDNMHEMELIDEPGIELIFLQLYDMTLCSAKSVWQCHAIVSKYALATND